MAYNIALSSSMRSNLLSLRNIATQMSRTQNILSTGKKINNAIDNASSYYQARSLTYRAADLNNLLDSMSQGIQTIQAAITGLERYDKFLEQATIIATESYEKAVIPTKEEILSQIGENGAVVTTAQELKDAIAANKKTICVYGKIDYFENQRLSLKANQKLVGSEYFTGYTGKERFSQINFSGTQGTAISAGSNCLISDLDFNFDNYNTSSTNFIHSNVTKVVLNNLDIKHISHNSLSSGASQGVISLGNSATVTINGIVNITSNKVKSGLSINATSAVTISKDAELNMNIKNSTWGNAILSGSSKLNIYGKFNAVTDKGILLNAAKNSGNKVNIYSGAEVILKQTQFLLNAYNSSTKYNSLFFEKGCKIYIKDASSTKYLEAVSDYTYDNKTSSGKYVYSSTFNSSGYFSQASGISINWSAYNPIKERE